MHSTMWLSVLVATVAVVASSQATQQAKSDPKAALINDGQPSEAVPETALLEEQNQSSDSDPKEAIINNEQPSIIDLETAMKNDEKSSLADPKATTSDDKQPLSAKERLLFLGSYSTLTHIIVTYSTSTIPSYCLHSAATVACPAGRRKRLLSATKLLNTKPFLNPSDGLDSSRAGNLEDDSIIENEEGGKKFLTVWTKTLSTTTLTTTSVNSATLISLSYYCTAGSIAMPSLCG